MGDNLRMELGGFGVANYRSFDDAGFFLTDLRKVNVFIGKNNSGKSNILRAIRLLARITAPRMPQGEKQGYQDGLCLKPELDSHLRNGAPPTAIVLLHPKELIQGLWQPPRRIGPLKMRWNTNTAETDTGDALQTLGDKELIWLHNELTSTHYVGHPTRKQVLTDLHAPLVLQAVSALRSLDAIITVDSFRELRKAEPTSEGNTSFNGHNVIERLRVMQHPRIGQEGERETFDELQQFVRGLLQEPELEIEVPKRRQSTSACTRSGYLSLHTEQACISS